MEKVVSQFMEDWANISFPSCQPFGLKGEMNDISGIQKMIYELNEEIKTIESQIHVCTSKMFALLIFHFDSSAFE